MKEPLADVDDYRLGVTRDNWRTHPFSRWAFQHAGEIVPSRALPPAAIARRLPERPLHRAVLERASAGDQLLWTDPDEGPHVDAVVALHRGQIVFEHYANGMARDVSHMVFSITKSLVGLTAERLIRDGRIDERVRVRDCVPELSESAFGEVSLRHLLDMTDGVAFDEDYANPDAEIHRYSGAYWGPPGGGGVVAALDRIRSRDAPAGGIFKYRTPAADVVGTLLRRCTGTSLADLVREGVWNPAGCADSGYMLVDTGGAEIAATGLNATPGDLARIAAWLMEPDQALLVNALMVGGNRQLVAAAMPDSPSRSYRSFWWIDEGCRPGMLALGVFGQRLLIDPANRFAMITLGSRPTASNIPTERLFRRTADVLLDVSIASERA